MIRCQAPLARDPHYLPGNRIVWFVLHVHKPMMVGLTSFADLTVT
jgi:hypothetical protein